MPIFSREDNKNLYESNLPAGLRNQIISFNELIMYFIKEKFKDYEGFDEVYEKIKERVKNTKYSICDINDALGTYDDESILISSKLLDDNTLENGKIESEKNLISIYFHEFFHLISAVLLGEHDDSRFEEGMADLFSDSVLLFFNIEFAKKDVLENQKSGYCGPNNILRNTAIFTEPSNLIWQYLTDKDKFRKIFLDIFGEEATDLMFRIDETTDVLEYMSDQEAEYIRNAIKNIDISNIPSVCIMRNEIIGKRICEKIIELGLTEEQARERFPNLPALFFKENEFSISDIARKRSLLVASETLDEKALDDLADEWMADNILSMDKFENFDATVIISNLYAYNLVSDGLEFDEQGIIDLLEGEGADYNLQKDLFVMIISKSKEIYNKFKGMSKDAMYEKVKNVFLEEFKNDIRASFYYKQYQDKKITNEEYLKKLLECIQKSRIDGIYVSNELLRKYIKGLVREISKCKKLDIQSFGEVKQSVKKTMLELNIPCEIDISSIIIRTWDPNNVSIIDVLDILSHFGLPCIYDGGYFEDVKIRGIQELSKGLDMEKALQFVKAVSAVNTDVFDVAEVFFSSASFKELFWTSTTSNIFKIIINFLNNQLKNGEKTLNDKVKNYDRDLLYFYHHTIKFNDVDDDDVEILKRVFNIDDDLEYEYETFFSSKFDIKKYNMLKEYPHLAVTYLSYYLPEDNSCTFENLVCAIDCYKEYEHPFLKEEYKKVIKKIINGILDNSYEIDDISCDDLIEHETKLLGYDLSDIIDDETKIDLMLKTFELISIKISILLNQDSENGQSKEEVIEQIRESIKNAIDESKDEGVKEELTGLLELLKNYNIINK